MSSNNDTPAAPPAAPSDGPQPDADAAAVRGEELPSARVALDRDLIVQTGLAYVDDHGLSSLSMRRLAGRLGVEAMALYHYVPSKERLLDAIADHMMEEVRTNHDVLSVPVDGWQAFLQQLAHGVRRAALEHPRAFPLIASRPPEAPWLRPPLRSIRWVEAFLSGLIDQGFNDRNAVAAYRAFTSFLLGHLLLEAAMHGADVGPLDVHEDPDDPYDLSSTPTLGRLAGDLAEDRAIDEFEEALEQLLDRLELMRLEQHRPPA